MLENMNFEVAHIGINFPDSEAAGASAGEFLRLFGIKPQDGKDSVYSGPLLELMKAPGRGAHGHIAIATSDISAARAYLEGLGCVFDDSSAKYDSDGRMIVLYLTDEIAGFAVHLLQK